MGSSRPGADVALVIPFVPLVERLCGSRGFRATGSASANRGWSRPRRLLFASWLTAVVALPLLGCGHAPLRPEHLGDPALVPIRAAFERTLAEARSDPAVSWQSGWLGNASINLFGGTRRGLCYEWRNLVYDGVVDTVRGVGWDATGVVISKGTYSEHSAVIVYDPKRIALDEVLAADPGRPVYVLDAWRRGEADIYPMHAWLNLPIVVRSPAQIKPCLSGSLPKSLVGVSLGPWTPAVFRRLFPNSSVCSRMTMPARNTLRSCVGRTGLHAQGVEPVVSLTAFRSARRSFCDAARARVTFHSRRAAPCRPATRLYRYGFGARTS